MRGISSLRFGKSTASIILYRYYLILILAATLTAGCARTGPPTGGPADETPPSVWAIAPLDGQVNIPLDASLLFEVDEWIEPQSFKDAFFISPEPEGVIKYRVGLSKIEVKFRKGLEKDKTYVVTVGTALQDLRRNPMAQSYTIAFSTGQKFDYGVVRGKVVGESAGMIAALYDLSRELLPLKKKADFMTQTGIDGGFELRYLPPGKYRLLIFSDADKDRLYNPESDILGLAPFDFSVNEDTTALTYIKAAARKPHLPRIQAVNPLHRERIDIVLDRPLEIFPRTEEFTIIDVEKGDSTALKEFWLHPLDSTRLVLETAPLDSIQYRIHIAGGVDFWGMAMRDSLEFKAVAVKDTLKPAILEVKAEGDTASAVIRIITSEKVNRESLAAGFLLPDSAKAIPASDIASVGYGAYSISTNALSQGDSFRFNLGALADLAGNRALDSVIVLEVEPYPSPPDSSEFGYLSGVIASEDTTSTVIILFEKGKETLSKSFPAPGKFSLMNVLPGRYTLEAFLDRDNNGRYDYGMLVPFRFPEKYTAVKDTFRVRAKWETDGVVIPFK